MARRRHPWRSAILVGPDLRRQEIWRYAMHYPPTHRSNFAVNRYLASAAIPLSQVFRSHRRPWETVDPWQRSNEKHNWHTEFFSTSICDTMSQHRRRMVQNHPFSSAATPFRQWSSKIALPEKGRPLHISSKGSRWRRGPPMNSFVLETFALWERERVFFERETWNVSLSLTLRSPYGVFLASWTDKVLWTYESTTFA